MIVEQGKVGIGVNGCPGKVYSSSLEDNEDLNSTKESESREKRVDECGGKVCEFENKLEIWRERNWKLTPLWASSH